MTDASLLARPSEYTKHRDTPAEHAARKDYFEKILAYMFAIYTTKSCSTGSESGKNRKSTVLKVVKTCLVPCNKDEQRAPERKACSIVQKDDCLAAADRRSLLIFNEIDERMVVARRTSRTSPKGT